MVRLSGAKYNGDEWEVEKKETKYYNNYKIINKEDGYAYELFCVIGFEQVSKDEFLVYKISKGEDFAIERYKMTDGVEKNIYSKDIYSFDFISDDNILLKRISNDAREYIDSVYSISKNEELENARWLKYARIIGKQDGKLLLNKTTYRDEKLLFAVDAIKLDVEPLCYSTLRDSYIEVKNKDDIVRIIHEDDEYGYNIKHHELAEMDLKLEDAKEKVLERITK